MAVSVLMCTMLLAAAAAVDLTHKDCGSTAVVTRVFSDDCKDVVCRLRKGHSYKMNIVYQPKEEVKKMNAKLYGVIAGIPIPFPLPQQDGCAASNATCPIAAGSTVMNSENLKVEPTYPALRLTARWKILDASTTDEDNGDNTIVCVETPVVIVA